MTRAGTCRVGHVTLAMECPGCAEARGYETTVEMWRWYRTRTSSRAVKDAITAHLATLSEPVSHGQPQPSSGDAIGPEWTA